MIASRAPGWSVLTTASTLHFFMSTCPGTHSLDHATLSASYPVVPKQTIASHNTGTGQRER